MVKESYKIRNFNKRQTFIRYLFQDFRLIEIINVLDLLNI
jgi:hypothetical protein